MEIDIFLIYGIKVGIEYVSREDLALPEDDEENISHMIVVDLLLVRCCFIFFT